MLQQVIINMPDINEKRERLTMRIGSLRKGTEDAKNANGNFISEEYNNRNKN